jgi:hypothetical protein
MHCRRCKKTTSIELAKNCEKRMCPAVAAITYIRSHSGNPRAGEVPLEALNARMMLMGEGLTSAQVDGTYQESEPSPSELAQNLPPDQAPEGQASVDYARIPGVSKSDKPLE